MRGIKEVIILTIMISVSPCFSSILSRNTFERYEGLDWPLPGWSSQTGNDGVVRLWQESDNEYQTQSHGVRSLHVYDPDNNSYATAYKSFTNSASEYMTEFYMWIPVDHQSIDSFPLCVLWNMPGEGLPEKTDVSLFLHESGDSFLVYLEDSAGIQQDVATIDSTDRWYKIQIYRYVSGGDTVVTFYLDGDSIDTYIPMNKNKVSNKISLGTTQSDSLADGEVFYDDIIISTPPVGDHPRLLFEEGDLSTLRARRNDTYIGGLGVSYATLWDTLQNLANGYYNSTTIHFPWPETDSTSKDTTSSYPYAQLPLHPADTVLDYWLSPLRQTSKHLRIFSLVGLIDNNGTYLNHCKGILNSLANWSTFVDRTNSARGTSYAHHCTGSIAYGMALAYDWLYDSLSDYEKLNIQNTLISLGINQCYLQALDFDEANEPPLTYANGRAIMFGTGMGMGCLSLDDTVALHDELDTARAKIDTILAHSDACGQEGGFNEGISYGAYANRHFISFLIADGTIDNYMGSNTYLANYPKWEIHSMLSGAEQYQINGNSGFGPNWDITFCDYDKWAGLWNPATCYIADYKNDTCFQWFAAKRRDMRWKEIGYFLWADTHLDSTSPASVPSVYPLSKLFSTIGWVTARTGWNNNDYIFALKSGQREPGSHRQKEQNSFIFGGKGRWLIADLGFARRFEIRERLFQNVLDDFEDNGTALWRKDSLVYRYYTTTDTFTYCKSIDTSYNALDPWIRQVLFFNKLGSFVISDYAERIVSIDSLHWRIHSWKAPTISENDRKIEINYADGPKLLGYIVFPESVDTDYETLSDFFIENGTTRYFRRIKVKIDNTVDTARVIAVFIPYDVGESATLTSIDGAELKGAKLKNDKGCAAALFGMKENTKGGKYEVSVTDSLLNIVGNLVPDTNYLVIKKKGTDDETVDTLQTNDVAILSFKLNSTGNWKVIITLARTTGSIEINKDNTYCNMPFVALNLEMTNPLDSNSVDSMRIWQDYTVNDTLYTDSTGWIPFDSTYFWYLRQGEETNKVYAQFMGNGWNESIEYCDSIVFDKTLPTGSFVIDNDSTFTNNSDVTLKNSL